MWAAVLVTTLMVLALVLGFWLGMLWSRSASAAVQEGAQSTLEAAKAVSTMTQVLAEEANRQAMVSSLLKQQTTLLEEQGKILQELRTSSQRMAETQVVLTDTFVNRGLMRRASPAQVGEREIPTPNLVPPPPPAVQKAVIRDSHSPRDPSATG